MNILDRGSAPIPQTGNKSTTNKPGAKQEASKKNNNIGKKRSTRIATHEANLRMETTTCEANLSTENINKKC
jgi:hypothetical protein